MPHEVSRKRTAPRRPDCSAARQRVRSTCQRNWWLTVNRVVQRCSNATRERQSATPAASGFSTTAAGTFSSAARCMSAARSAGCVTTWTMSGRSRSIISAASA